tara:strand:- start:2845 stop:3771 length:927 start_codon:yes stop_codon:yes gene_type:complete
MKMIENTLLVEKYRPHTIDEFVGNEFLKEKITNYITEQDIPHLLFFGRPGTGKTTLAKILVRHIDCDYIYINASDENSVDIMRTKIKTFSSSMSLKKMKIVILDESDYITPNAQAALRNIMETFSKITRFILTCNYVDRVIEPIQSRCQEFEIYPPSKSDIAKHIHGILEAERIEYEQNVLAEIINSYYPDLRKIINCIQKQSITGKLLLDKTALMESDYKQKILQLLESPDKKTWRSIRQVVANNKIRDFSLAYRFLYDKVDDYASNGAGQVLLTIAQYQHWDAVVVDKEINFMACIISILDVTSNG